MKIISLFIPMFFLLVIMSCSNVAKLSDVGSNTNPVGEGCAQIHGMVFEVIIEKAQCIDEDLQWPEDCVEPIEGAKVCAKLEGGGGESFCATTNESGKYEKHLPQNGEYDLLTTAERFDSSEDRVEVEGKTLVDIDLQAKEEDNAEIYGMVFEVIFEKDACIDEGLQWPEDCIEAIQGAEVCAKLAVGGGDSFCATTNELGMYEKSLPKNGLYELHTTAEGFDNVEELKEVEGRTKADIDFRR